MSVESYLLEEHGIEEKYSGGNEDIETNEEAIVDEEEIYDLLFNQLYIKDKDIKMSNVRFRKKEKTEGHSAKQRIY